MSVSVPIFSGNVKTEAKTAKVFCFLNFEKIFKQPPNYVAVKSPEFCLHSLSGKDIYCFLKDFLLNLVWSEILNDPWKAGVKYFCIILFLFYDVSRADKRGGKWF